MAYDPKKWKGRKEDKLLEEKYGENARLIKRTMIKKDDKKWRKSR